MLSPVVTGGGGGGGGGVVVVPAPAQVPLHDARDIGPVTVQPAHWLIGSKEHSAAPPGHWQQ
ncbi:hypothetical protein C1280_35425 [Gemmata obscuriglobus]|uniref:Uncharacterized protein n=1 Tax=Gemmata obscuriglobus TaxID=114 RepID=A0A2Z3HA61_9BACT|nr:hypothetical protein C1280_35425 [Gemmata obscuriglobus]